MLVYIINEIDKHNNIIKHIDTDDIKDIPNFDEIYRVAYGENDIEIINEKLTNLTHCRGLFKNIKTNQIYLIDYLEIHEDNIYRRCDGCSKKSIVATFCQKCTCQLCFICYHKHNCNEFYK